MLLHLMAPDEQLVGLTNRLEPLGVQVRPSARMSGGVHVRVREGTDDEAEVQAIVDAVAPNARRGPSGTPTHGSASSKRRRDRAAAVGVASACASGALRRHDVGLAELGEAGSTDRARTPRKRRGVNRSLRAGLHGMLRSCRTGCRCLSL